LAQERALVGQAELAELAVLAEDWSELKLRQAKP